MSINVNQASELKVDTSQAPDIKVDTTNNSLFSRQALSAPGKFAFWGFLVGGFLGLSGVLALLMVGGTASPDLIVTAVGGIAGAAILATRFRWAPLLSTLVAGYMLYQIFTEPYAIESLIHPKIDPQGGFGHFVGVLFLIAFELLLLSNSVGEAVHNYHQRKQAASHWLSSTLNLVAGLLIGAMLIGAVTQEALPSGTASTNGVPTVHMTAGSFAQSSITVAKGSKLLLVDDVSALHMLSNGSWQNGLPQAANEPGAPGVHNLQINGGNTQIGPFNTAGTYHIYCELHQGMNLTIIVQ